MLTLRQLPLLVLPALMLAGCGSADGADGASDAPPPSLAISSAKRQCKTVASLSGEVPSDAAQQICDCSIDKLVEDGAFTASKQPDDATAQAVMDGCIDQFLKDQEAP
ncbi:MAG: hypothetical protein R3E18_06755 [Sphingomonadaceae bacterium]